MKNLIITIAISLICKGAGAEWNYVSDTDTMTGKPMNAALLRSSNSLSLGSPYNGENYGTLLVAKDKQIGFAFGLSVEKGQIICDAYRGCAVAFRFDDAPPTTFRAVTTKDYSTKNLAFRDGRRFVAAAAKAKKILVQITMYQEGAQVLEFNTTKPLEWKATK